MMMIAFLKYFGAGRRPGLLGLGRRGVFALSGIGRVPAGDRSFAGRDGIGPFPDALRIPASST
jgi:hypothetical protein